MTGRGSTSDGAPLLIGAACAFRIANAWLRVSDARRGMMAVLEGESESMRHQPRSAVITSLAYDWVAGLPPAYFSLVMATGIVSIASDLSGMAAIARLLLIINLAAFTVLWIMTGLRLILCPQRLLGDLRSHAVGPGYFTMVAAAGVLGAQLLTLTGQAGLAIGLWVFAGLLWLVITYAFFAVAITQSTKPALADGLGGVWLIASVATQSLAVLGTLVAVRLPAYEEVLLALSLVFHLVGCMLYLQIIGLIFYRLTFLPLAPAAFTPPYWINMGATAIATQAGATLILHGGQSDLLLELQPFLKGFTLFFWAAGTWWIPLLILLSVWTYLVRRVPMTYTPQFWGAVFPMGMYTASTYQLAKASGSDFLLAIPEVTVYVALLAWGLAFFGLLRTLAKGLLPRNGA